MEGGGEEEARERNERKSSSDRGGTEVSCSCDSVNLRLADDSSLTLFSAAFNSAVLG